MLLAINLPSLNGIAENCEVNGELSSTFNALFADQHFLPYIGILANLCPAICKPPADKNGTVWSFIYLMHLSCSANRNEVDVAFKSHLSSTVSRDILNLSQPLFVGNNS